MAVSFWQYRATGDGGVSSTPSGSHVVLLDATYNLRKILVSQASFGARHTSTTGTTIPTPHISYVIDWQPAQGDLKRIFHATYRIPGDVAALWSPATNQAVYITTYSAGDLEIGMNEKYNYDAGGQGTSSITFAWAVNTSTGDGIFDVWRIDFLLGVLGQR